MNLFLDGRSLAQKVEDAKNLLREQGYLVRGPMLFKHEVQTPSHLVRFFYDMMAQRNPQLEMVYAGNTQKDRAIAKRLIEARIDLGSSRQRAIEESCELIELLFQYEGELGLSFRVTSMSVLGQESMGWVTERLWQIREGLNSAVESELDRKWFDALYLQQENNISHSRLLEAQKRMDGVLLRDGKTKE